MIFLQ